MSELKIKYGNKYWYNKDDQIHREDGPAIESFDGDKHWYKNGLLHREDGPALEFSDGTKYWYQNGLCHRLDGPAAEYSDGDNAWYYQGKEIKVFSQKEFERYLNLKAFI